MRKIDLSKLTEGSTVTVLINGTQDQMIIKGISSVIEIFQTIVKNENGQIKIDSLVLSFGFDGNQIGGTCQILSVDIINNHTPKYAIKSTNSVENGKVQSVMHALGYDAKNANCYQVTPVTNIIYTSGDSWSRCSEDHAIKSGFQIVSGYEFLSSPSVYINRSPLPCP